MMIAILAAFTVTAFTRQLPAPPVTKKSVRGDVELIFIPAGEFTMGATLNLNERPIRQVYLDGYWIGKNIVTVGQFKEFCKETKYKYDFKALKPQWGWIDNHPMVLVNWDDSRAFCKWAGGDLPTEAQWEKAARGPGGRQFPWGERFQPKLLCTNTTQTAPVGSFPAGASYYGCLDMAGNVYQWCLDYYGANYEGLPDKNPTGPAVGQGRVLRGGDWGDDNPKSFRSAYRYADRWLTGPPSSSTGYKAGGIRTPLYGFRLAMNGSTP